MTLKAVVRNGRLVLDEPIDLPDGTEVELAIVTDARGAAAMRAPVAAPAADEARDLLDFEAAITHLGTKL